MKSLQLSIDYNYQPINIGDFILTMLVACVLFEKCQLNAIELNIAYDPGASHSEPGLKDYLLPSNKQKKIFDIIQLAQLMPELRAIRFYDSIEHLASHMDRYNDVDDVCWPTKEVLLTHRYLFYESIQLLSDYIKNNNKFIYLNFSGYLRNNAIKFYRKYVYPNIPVTVNLRGNQYFHSHRNALLDVWKQFFTGVVNRYPVTFVIIGSHGEVCEDIARLNNVVYAKKFCTGLVDDVALLAYSAFHLGSASGPSLIKYFTASPYFIFNCDMKPYLQAYGGALIEEADTMHYAFATPFQNFGTEPETLDAINFQFEKIWKSSDWLEWAFVDFYKRKTADIPYWF